MLHILGNKGIKHVSTTVGPEQEYFLVPKELYKERKDLVFCGRTFLVLQLRKDRKWRIITLEP